MMPLKLDKSKKYLLACSFGPDSMALFSMLLNEGYQFDVAFVNYNLREESKQEEKDIKEFCNKNNIQLFVKNVKDYEPGNIEAQCRSIRYKFFKELNDLSNYECVLVAHHQDDLLETYIMQKNRKNLVKHYGLIENIKIFGVDIYRPLLSFSKKELLKYCDDNHIPYSLDKTNFEDNYLRNRIRHSIVEKMSQKDRNELLKEIDNRNKELDLMFQKLNSLDLHCADVILRLNKTEQLYALNEICHEVSGYSISASFGNQIIKALKSNKPNIVIPFHKSFSFVKSYDKCFFQHYNEFQYSYLIESPSVFECDYFYLDFTKNTSNRNVTLNDYPLIIRNAKANDEYLIKDYTVKVNRLFIDWKMPLNLRKRWPVIINKDGKIIYIPRYQKDFKPTKDINFFVK